LRRIKEVLEGERLKRRAKKMGKNMKWITIAVDKVVIIFII